MQVFWYDTCMHLRNDSMTENTCTDFSSYRMQTSSLSHNIDNSIRFNNNQKKFPSNWKQNIITWTKCSYQIKDQYFNTQLWQLFINKSVQSWLPQCFCTFPFVPFGKLSSYDFHEKWKQILMRMLVYFILTFIFKLKFTK